MQQHYSMYTRSLSPANRSLQRGPMIASCLYGQLHTVSVRKNLIGRTPGSDGEDWLKRYDQEPDYEGEVD